MTAQRYVSDELTHFVGRDLVESMPGDEQRGERDEKLYKRLIRILKDGQLLTGRTEHGVNADSSASKEGITVQQIVTYTVGARSLATMFDAAVVCFCDIPVGDVQIHIAKYGPFGLAFPRDFLLKHGVNPVLYLAEDARLEDGRRSNGEFFVEEMNHASIFLSDLMWAEKKGIDVSKSVSNDAMRAQQFLNVHVFPLIKGFRGAAAEDDPANYYMEREWRRYGDLGFELDDVCRVYLPESFAKRLRVDLPDYYGQVTFAAEVSD
jgi:hypothetical protein